MSFRGKIALVCSYQISRTLDSFLGFPFSLLPCPVTPGSCTQVGCRAPLVSPPHLPWLLNARHSLCGWWIVIGAPWAQNPQGRTLQAHYSFWEPHPFLSVPALPLKDAGLCLKDDSSSHTAPCGLQASFPRMPAPPKAISVSLYLPEMLKAEIHHFLFFIPETRVHNIPLRQWSCLLTQASDASSSFVFTWLCMISSLGRVPNPETPSSGVEGGFLAPRLEVGREWVRWTWHVEDPLSLFWIIA